MARQTRLAVLVRPRARKPRVAGPAARPMRVVRSSILMLCATTACASGGMLTSDRARVIDALFADYTGAAVPGASLIVIRAGRVIYRNAYGMADVGQDVRAETYTDNLLASVTREFSALAM